MSNSIFKFVQINIKHLLVSFFSEDHSDIFDHKYHINQGNLFSICSMAEAFFFDLC